jgi:hypothetical protein
LSEIEDWIDDPWLLDEKLNLSGPCPSGRGRVFVINSKAAFDSAGISCGINDFLLVSSKLFLAVGGFNEYPGNFGLENAIAAKFMRIVPGMVVQFFLVPVVKRYHPPTARERVPDLDADGIAHGFVCRGHSPLVKKFGDFPQWGLSTMRFEEIQK